MKYAYTNEENLKTFTDASTSKKTTSDLSDNPKSSNFPTWAKVLIIIFSVILMITVLTVGCSLSIGNVIGSTSGSFSDISSLLYGGSYTTGYFPEDSDYVATIYIEGTIDEDGAGTYNHSYILNAIEALEDDENNVGIILNLNTGGGTVYASDEVYLKLLEYKEKTGNPIYASMQSTCASGGYYIACAADELYINRNGITGSIGVTFGQFFDFTELLEKYGVKVTTITTGDNKAMGSSFIEMTDEQYNIYKDLLMETYDQFTSIVSASRGLDLATVKELADGRVYSAKQAVANKLVDGIMTYEEVKELVEQDLGYDKKDDDEEDELVFVDFRSEVISSSFSSLFGQSGSNDSELNSSDLEKILNMNGQFRLMYMSNIG